MSNNLIQPSLSSGELSPHLHARVDLERYQTGLAQCRNFFVDFRGGVTKRAGTAFVGVLQNSSRLGRLTRFSFNRDQNYVLEWSNQVVRFIKDGGYILNSTAKTITNISSAVQANVSSTAHGFSNGDQVYIAGVGGMTQVNGKVFTVSDVLVNQFKIKYLNGDYVDSTGFGAYTSGGTARKLYEVATPYADTDLFDLKFAQSGDVLTLTHPDYAPRELKRLAEDSWTLTTISFAATISAPGTPSLTKSSNGKTKYSYRVTAVNDKGEESVPSGAATITHAVNIGAVAGSISIDWAAVSGADHYRVYKANPITGADATFPTGTQYGFIGRTTDTEFIDPNILPDFTRCPPKQLNPFSGGNNPAVVGYYQQRIVYGGSDDNPETLNFSQTGQFKNFDEAIPVKDSDAIEATVASLEINRIKYLVTMPGGLLALTSGSTFQINGGGPDQPITPSSVSAVPQTYNGCGDVSPIAIDYNLVYVQGQGTVIRSLTYNFYTGSYNPQDMSLFSQHLLRQHHIVDWCWSEEPDRVIWAVRDDGYLVSLTYVPDQKISGMALHYTEGLVESCCTVQEGTENAVYLMVRRKINGTWFRCTERMASRNYTYGLEAAWALDCAIERSRETPAFTLTPRAASGSNVAFDASGSAFQVGDIGKVIRVGGGIATITSLDSGTRARCTITKDITAVIPMTNPPIPVDADSGEWSMAPEILTVSGLDFFNGHTVMAFADGVPVPDLVVSAGRVTLPNAASRIIVGLPYDAKLKTLPIDTGQLPTVQGKRKNIHALTVRVADTKGLYMGSEEDRVKAWRTPAYLADDELLTMDMRMVMDPNWQEPGTYYITMTDPYPASILGIIPELNVGDTSK